MHKTFDTFKQICTELLLRQAEFLWAFIFKKMSDITSEHKRILVTLIEKKKIEIIAFLFVFYYKIGPYV